MACGKIELMFLPKDHAAFEIDRKRLAVWTDIRHLQWGFAQMAGIQRNATAWEDPAEEVVVLFYIGLILPFDEFVAPTPIFL